MAGTYSFQFCGRCLADYVPNGAWMTADRSAEIAPLDLVSLILKDVEGPYAEFINTLGDQGFIGVCKLFLGMTEGANGEPVYLVAQLNPPAISPVPASAVEALHKVTSTAPIRLNKSVLSLFEGFVQGGAIAAVKPDWQPAWPRMGELEVA